MNASQCTPLVDKPPYNQHLHADMEYTIINAAGHEVKEQEQK